MKTANKILLAAGVALVAGAALWSLRPAAIAVESAEVVLGSFEQTISEDGRTRVRERYVVSAPLAGRVERITLRAGDAVNAGDPVAVLTPALPALLDARAERELTERVGAAEAQQLRSLAEVRKADAQLAQANADLARNARLSTEGFVSATAREQSELALRTAQRTLEAAQFAAHASEHELEQARAVLLHFRSAQSGKSAATRWTVKSPVRGAVLRVVQESEGAVALGAPLLELANPRSLEAVIDVLSQEAVDLRPGMPARITVGGSGGALSARVQRIEPAAFTKVSALGVEEQRVNVVLDITETPRTATLGDGFRVEADIVVFVEPSAVKVPVGALFRTGKDWAVFVVEGGRAVRRGIDIGRRNGHEALVAAGLKPGERVVLYPPDTLKDGKPVSLRPAS